MLLVTTHLPPVLVTARDRISSKSCVQHGSNNSVSTAFTTYDVLVAHIGDCRRAFTVTCAANHDRTRCSSTKTQQQHQLPSKTSCNSPGTHRKLVRSSDLTGSQSFGRDVQALRRNQPVLLPRHQHCQQHHRCRQPKPGYAHELGYATKAGRRVCTCTICKFKVRKNNRGLSVRSRWDVVYGFAAKPRLSGEFPTPTCTKLILNSMKTL